MRVPSLALALSIALVGCLGATEDVAPSGVAAQQTDAALVADLLYDFEGTMLATPAAPGEQAFAFDVPKGATAVAATVTWSGSPVSSVGIHLLDSAGDEQGDSFPEEAGRASTATVEPPRSGEWQVVVTSTRALNAPFQVAVNVSFIVPLDNVLANTVEMAAADFVELNLIMEEKAVFNWSFSSTSDLAWDIHSHENGETVIHEEAEGAAHEGTFEAPKRQIYSIFFQSRAPATVAYSVEGAFRVHSHSQ